MACLCVNCREKCDCDELLCTRCLLETITQENNKEAQGAPAAADEH